eukprot:CAMPEP_0116122016 /NCGR_PEP_ID=MMETSP0329-20121206/3995_1 /TAXON_ID=697910 /ORGANISM="Pseudo-nitzschia arenysensis, Strain B593" /LENGTH=801 /DNA_ID=CAMNT_0003615847 /DNA_START=137 /DNA_END=2542 /DNA_ORIENTATION=+
MPLNDGGGSGKLYASNAPPSPAEQQQQQQAEQSARFEFPKMLYNMLEDCTFDERYSHIVSWQPHGLAFKVHNRDELEKILSRWFREKYESFRCLLEQWGFLKLTRGKDRGCWYHKKFYYHRSSSTSIHSKNRYHNINKDDFIESMPDYLSFRDEPDLEKESTEVNRISPVKKMKESNALAKKDSKSKKISVPNKRALESDNEETDSLIRNKQSRYRSSTRRECPYCHVSLTAQGFKNHVKSCRIVRKKRKSMDGDSDSDSSNILDDESDSGSEERKISADGGRACRHCGEFFSKYGYKSHERRCKFFLPSSNKKNAKANANSNEIRNANVIDNETNRKEEVPSDDSSIDSVESGCRICGFDDDHANLLLCEGCDTEVHTYCLTPPLEKVPTGDWFCDACKLRKGKAQEEFGILIKNLPSEMTERFGEICFAKSAENAHWWPALIFDPRSFLHNPEVVDLARRNLGKRYLVFFFENQDAFAAIPKRWIMTWDEAVEKDFDKGKSVRNASKSRKLQFERAMTLATGAFEEASFQDSESDDSEFHSPSDSDIEDSSLSSRIPRVIGGNSSIFDVVPDFDWKPIRSEVRQEVEDASPSEYPETVENEAHVTRKKTGKSQVQVFFGGRHLYIGMFSDVRKAAYAVKLFKEKMQVASDAFEKNNTLAPPRKKRLYGKKIVHSNPPSVVGPSPESQIDFGTFTDKKPIGRRTRLVPRAKRKIKTTTKVDHVLQQTPPQPKPPERKTQPQSPERTEKKHDLREEEKESPEKTPTTPLMPMPPPLSDRERNELLLKTSLCQYYLLPLSQL